MSTEDRPDVYPSMSGLKTSHFSLPSAGLVLGGQFELVEQLGAGAFGLVWKARDRYVADRFVCIKLLPPELQSDPVELARVRQMFSRVHALQHENLCPLYLLGDDARFKTFIVMKYLEGVTLGQYAAQYRKVKGPLPIKVVLVILSKVAAALDYVHKQGLVHRDIKPANIMVNAKTGDVQVVDLGLAAEIRSSMSRVSKSGGDVTGTAPYMAPEQWRGLSPDGRADQYSLGVVAYELLTGHLPFDAPNSLAWMNCALNETPPPLTGEYEELSNSLLQAIAKDLCERYSNCVAFVRAMKDRWAKAAPSTQSPAVSPQKEETTPPNRIDHQTAARREYGESGLLEDDAQSLFELGKSYLEDQEKSDSKSKAARFFRLAAEKGHAQAQFELAFCYENGKGVSTDEQEAVKWYRQAAEKGHAQAQFELAFCYENGKGVSTDEQEAVKWYRRAAERGSADAMTELSYRYDHGYGVPQDENESLKWYRQSNALNGDTDAQVRLGLCYERGEGVSQDYSRAVQWYHRAAEQGNAYAQYCLGLCYANGQGVPMSKDKAIDWLKKSSEQGNLQAQNLLRNDRVANPRSSLPSLLVAPFGEEVAKDAQKDWARYLGRSVIETNAIGMRVVLIPPGEFMMGSLYSQEIRDADETPQHRTVISKPFFLGETQVSQNQWGLVMKTAPWRGKPGVRDGDDYPATYVSWVDAVEFCKRISEKDGRAYRLPSEAEWEYACRAGTRTAWSFGDTMEHLDHYSCSFKYAYQVRQKKPNPWALYDMHGNVWEWCNDRYDENYYKVSPTEDPPGPYGGTLRVLRGGSWNYAGYYTRSAARFKLPPRSRYDSLGFRVGYSLE